MCETTSKIAYPPCHSTKVVKNGKKKTVVQYYLCSNGRQQFIYFYKNQGASPSTKHLLLSMLLRTSGLQELAMGLQVSRKTVLNTLLKEAEKRKITSHNTPYKLVQIDEFSLIVKTKRICFDNREALDNWCLCAQNRRSNWLHHREKR